MGLLVEGKWQDRWYDTSSSGGSFERSESRYRNWVTTDGSAGPTGDAGFAAEAGRYHLYVSYACPWAHRALMFRALKGLDSLIDVSVVHWYMAKDGWSFAPDDEGIVLDRLFGHGFLREVYLAADARYTGRVTVPLLWDQQRSTIVSNESADIIRMFNSAFEGVGATPGDYCPAALRDETDTLNARIYDNLNNGVYRCGFATTQTAHEAAVGPLFDTLDMLEERLSTRRYLLGDAPTEADWRLLPTLLRFDMVYFGHFKCNVRRIVDYPNLWAYTRDLYQHEGIAGTCHFGHAKQHYYTSHETVNPTRIVPVGPDLDLDAPHGRQRL